MRLFLLLALMASILLSTTAMQPLGRGYNSQCKCLQLESRVIPRNSLKSVEIIPRGSHCKNTEVIAGLTSGERICLNPKTAWVRKLVQFIEKKERETKKA
ncbi:interleukin-8-like [Astyanax mexicanus]|uniref:C-X-C motif chemokine n=2 Tax=Astyanax mexicanus TaxID=7994 RepID=A0A8B9J4P3_ASTMX|nr:interleukin-8-like [Astyanax mexicanus]KAG9274550.1 interleukin-8-like [Astyanax mexicanus]